MLRTLRIALVGVLSIAVFASLLGEGAPRAQTSPPAGMPDAASSRPRVTLSKTQWAAANLVTKARNKAVTKSGATLDYRKTKKVFAGNKKYGTDWRRQMAAGYRQTGGKIKNISKAEKKKVEAMRKKIYGKKKARRDSVARILLDGPHCTGRSGKVVVNKNESHTYWNSCQTNDVLYAWGGCIATMGAVIK